MSEREKGMAPAKPEPLSGMEMAIASALRAGVSGAVAGKAYAIIALGMLLLIATPVARVGLSVLFFPTRRDRLYVGITLLVLAVLLLSFWIGVG